MGYFFRSDLSLLVYVILSGPKLISWIELIFKNWEEQFHVPIKQCFKWYLRHLRKFFSKGSISFHVGCYVKLPRKSETSDFVMLSAVDVFLVALLFILSRYLPTDILSWLLFST